MLNTKYATSKSKSYSYLSKDKKCVNRTTSWGRGGGDRTKSKYWLYPYLFHLATYSRVIFVEKLPVGSVEDLRTGGCWLDQYSFPGLMIGLMIHSSLTAVHYIDDDYTRKATSGLDRIWCGVLVEKEWTSALAATI